MRNYIFSRSARIGSGGAPTWMGRCSTVIVVVEEVWPATLLAWIAGFIDALGYLMLSDVFTAHMSGNSAAFGAHVGEGNWRQTVIRGLAIPPFILGIGIGVLSHAIAERYRIRARLMPALVMELVCLVIFVCLSSSNPVTPEGPKFYILVTLLGMAMGLQSATLHRAGKVHVQTTAITGTLINMTENAVLFLVRLWDRLSGRAVDNVGPKKPVGPLAATFASVFLSFILGTVCGGVGETKWGSISLIAPMAGLVALIFLDFLREKPRNRS